MATRNGKAVPLFCSEQSSRQQQLFSLISRLCVPRQSSLNSDVCRLIVDSRLSWSFERIDADRSWMYLPEAVEARLVAGCLILSAD
jgi:hypothetical protein